MSEEEKTKIKKWYKCPICKRYYKEDRIDIHQQNEWVERVKENLRIGDVWACDLGEDLYRVPAGRGYCRNYLVCIHDPENCTYKPVPEQEWKEDDHEEEIRERIEECQEMYEDYLEDWPETYKGREVAVHSTDEVFADFYGCVLTSRGEEGLLSWL